MERGRSHTVRFSSPLGLGTGVESEDVSGRDLSDQKDMVEKVFPLRGASGGVRSLN